MNTFYCKPSLLKYNTLDEFVYRDHHKIGSYYEILSQLLEMRGNWTRRVKGEIDLAITGPDTQFGIPFKKPENWEDLTQLEKIAISKEYINAKVGNNTLTEYIKTLSEKDLIDLHRHHRIQEILGPFHEAFTKDSFGLKLLDLAIHSPNHNRELLTTSKMGNRLVELTEYFMHGIYEILPDTFPPHFEFNAVDFDNPIVFSEISKIMEKNTGILFNEKEKYLVKNTEEIKIVIHREREIPRWFIVQWVNAVKIVLEQSDINNVILENGLQNKYPVRPIEKETPPKNNCYASLIPDEKITKQYIDNSVDIFEGEYYNTGKVFFVISCDNDNIDVDVYKKLHFTMASCPFNSDDPFSYFPADDDCFTDIMDPVNSRRFFMLNFQRILEINDQGNPMWKNSEIAQLSGIRDKIKTVLQNIINNLEPIEKYSMISGFQLFSMTFIATDKNVIPIRFETMPWVGPWEWWAEFDPHWKTQINGKEFYESLIQRFIDPHFKPKKLTSDKSLVSQWVSVIHTQKQEHTDNGKKVAFPKYPHGKNIRKKNYMKTVLTNWKKVPYDSPSSLMIHFINPYVRLMLASSVNYDTELVKQLFHYTKNAEIIDKIFPLYLYLGNKKVLSEKLKGKNITPETLQYTKGTPFPKLSNEKWIVKPAIGKQADGVFISTDYNELYQHIQNRPENEWVISQYISNPHLFTTGEFKNKKYHIRVFVLITKKNKSIGVFLFDKIYRYYAVLPYDNNDIHNEYKHITNLHKGLEYYNGDVSKLQELTDSADFNTLNPSLQNLIKENIIQTLEIIKGDINCVFETQKCYHYVAFDFLLDSNSRPWLLEVNTSPGMNAMEDVNVERFFRSIVELNVNTNIKEESNAFIPIEDLFQDMDRETKTNISSLMIKAAEMVSPKLLVKSSLSINPKQQEPRHQESITTTPYTGMKRSPYGYNYYTLCDQICGKDNKISTSLANKTKEALKEEILIEEKLIDEVNTYEEPKLQHPKELEDIKYQAREKTKERISKRIGKDKCSRKNKKTTKEPKKETKEDITEALDIYIKEKFGNTIENPSFETFTKAAEKLNINNKDYIDASEIKKKLKEHVPEFVLKKLKHKYQLVLFATLLKIDVKIHTI